MPARKIDYPTWLPRQIGGSRVKDSEKLVTKGDLTRQSGRNSRIPAIFAEHRPSPALLRTGNGYRLPASGVESPPVSTSQSRSAASADDQAVTAERCAAQTAPWRPGGQRRGGRWAAAGHPGTRRAWRAACDPGAFRGTVRLGRRLRPHAALADRHLAKPRHLAPGPRRGLLVAASADHPPSCAPGTPAGWRKRAYRRKTRTGRWPPCGPRWPPAAR